MSEESRQKIIGEYKKAYDTFASVSGMTQLAITINPPIEVTKTAAQNSYFMKSLLSGGVSDKSAGEQPIINQLSDYVVDPKNAENVPVTSLYESAEFMRNVSGQLLNSGIGNVIISNKVDSVSPSNNIGSRTNITQEINSARAELESLGNQVVQESTPKENTDHISDYYRSLLDLEFCSKNFNTIIEACSELTKEITSQPEKSAAPVNLEVRKGILQSALNSFTKKVNQIVQRFKTLIKDTDRFLLIVLFSLTYAIRLPD